MVFGCTDACDMFHLDHIPAYKLRYLPCFSASILRLWSQLKGGCKEDQWVLLCDQDPPLPIADISSCKSYCLLSQLEVVPHRCIEKFQCFGFLVPWPSVCKTSTSGSLPVRPGYHLAVFSWHSPHGRPSSAVSYERRS